MLTKIDYAGISGISGVEWDAVELLSQFMENWCWEKRSWTHSHFIMKQSKNYQIAYLKALATKNYNSHVFNRQIEFSFDFAVWIKQKINAICRQSFKKSQKNISNPST